MATRKEKPAQPSNERYRKPAKHIRLRKPIADAAQKLVDHLASDMTQLVNDAVREKLEREGYWPLRKPE